MAEVTYKTDGDALSRLIQLQAGRYEIRLNWTGKGVDDLVSLCTAHSVKARLAKHLWSGLRELMQMPELALLPEPVAAHIMSIVLKSQALTDLDTEAHQRRMAQTDKTKGAT